MANAISFEDQLNLQMLENEKFRNLILASILTFILILVLTVSILYQGELKSFLGDVYAFHWISIFLIFLIIRALNIRRLVGRRLRDKKKIPIIFAYISSFVEVSIPTLVMIFVSPQNNSLFILMTPLPYLYFLFIILSTLDLNIKLSIFTGSVAAIEYIILALYYIKRSSLNIAVPVLDIPVIYLAKGGIIFLSGIIAGLIAREIRNKTLSSYQAVAERKDLETLFGQQVSPALLDDIINTKHKIISRKIPVCIMFFDIRGFTSISEGKTPEDIICYQNDIFADMIEIITRNNGIINQFMGDGFMATFGAPIPSEQDCQNAVNSALEINNNVEKKSKLGKITETRFGIGIHRGEVVTGNVGTDLRKQFSVTGNAVIISSRLEQLNKQYGSSILISKEVFHKVRFEQIKPQSLGYVPIKGRSEPVEIYKIK